VRRKIDDDVKAGAAVEEDAVAVDFRERENREQRDLARMRNEHADGAAVQASV